jgi:hydroxymethylbilane synthase
MPLISTGRVEDFWYTRTCLVAGQRRRAFIGRGEKQVGQSDTSGALRVGTRGSLLARTQTGWVVDQLRTANPGVEVTIEIIQTTGDLRRDIPFAAVGTKGMFVKEIEQALLDGHIDVGVHSLKDMPSELPEGLELACVPVRENPYDALLTRSAVSLSDLPIGAVVGTSSIRRQAQLRYFRQDLKMEELRGNLDTRLRKLEEGQYDAVVLAAAGLNRMGWGDRISEELSPNICVPAAGQGALALETRVGDAVTLNRLLVVHDPESADAIAAERAFLAALGGGCSVPAGAHAAIEGERLSLVAMVAAPDGSRLVRARESDNRANAAALGARIAQRLLNDGGRELLQR